MFPRDESRSSPTFAEWREFPLLGGRPQAIFEAAFPQHLPKKTPIGAKMRRDAATSSTLIIVLAPAFRF
jgi:hypothetical protein